MIFEIICKKNFLYVVLKNSFLSSSGLVPNVIRPGIPGGKK